MCNLFADFFSTIYTSPSATAPVYSCTTNVNISSIQVLATEVEKSLKNLNSSKGPGPDMIPAIVLSFCSEVLAPHLSLYFNSFLSLGVFPSNLKTGFLVPIHKSDTRSSVKNYRPIVIQSTMAKVFEKIVLDRMTFAFRSTIVPQQHGFQPGKSTTTNLVVFINKILTAFSNGNQLDCIYLDFSKAFDRVSHPHLLRKLEALGVTRPLLTWVQSYLAGRTLHVKYANMLSRPVAVSSGVPQGSHLGPFLFSLFVNDIGSLLNGNFLLYADDIKIFREVSSVSQQGELQTDLEKIQTWCLVNEMALNLKKCVVITYSRTGDRRRFDYMLQGASLHRVDSVRDLGVLLTSTLDFGMHISNIINKATRTLGLISRTCRQGFSLPSFRTLYVSLVRPILEFSSVVWSPYQVGQISSFDVVQGRFFRMVGVRLGYQYMDVNLQAVQLLLRLPNLADRRTMMDTIFLFKLLNGLVDCPEILHQIDFHVPRNARHCQLFARHHFRTNYQYYSTIPRLMRTGNELCSAIDFFGPSIEVFKKNIAVLLLSY